MFSYSSRACRQRSVSVGAQSTNSLEYAVRQDLQTIVLPLYKQKLQELHGSKETRSFSCFTCVFQSTQLALLLRYPAHWKPHGTKALYGCVPVRCNYNAFVQWIYSIVANCILAAAESQAVFDDSQSLISNESFWCEVSLYVFTLYALHEIATFSPKPPFDGQSTSDGERQQNEKRIRSYLPMGLQSNENPKILYRRSFPESNRIRCSIELYATLMQLQNTCYMLGPPSQATKEGCCKLSQWIAVDLAQIVQRLLNPCDDRMELCAYMGPCSLEGYASTCENRMPMHSDAAMETVIAGSDKANIDPDHEDNDDPKASAAIDATEGSILESDGDPVKLQELLQEYVALRQQCKLASTTVTAASTTVHNDSRRRRVRARLSNSMPSHDDALLEYVPCITVNPLVQMLRLYDNHPVEQHPLNSQKNSSYVLPATDDEGEDAIGMCAIGNSQPANVSPEARMPAIAILEDDQSLVSTWTNGTALGVGQSALHQLLSKVGPTAAEMPATKRWSTVAASSTSQEYGHFFLDHGSSSIADVDIPHSGNYKRKASCESSATRVKQKNIAASRPESDIEQSDASNSVSSLLSYWLATDVAQPSRKEAAFSDEDSTSDNSFSSSSSPGDMGRHPTIGQKALSALLSLAGDGKNEVNEEDEDEKEL